jgi:hypothetical protein
VLAKHNKILEIQLWEVQAEQPENQTPKNGTRIKAPKGNNRFLRLLKVFFSLF